MLVGHLALIVAALYLLYHGIENYLLAPWAYGDRLKLSNIAEIRRACSQNSSYRRQKPSGSI